MSGKIIECRVSGDGQRLKNSSSTLLPCDNGSLLLNLTQYFWFFSGNKGIWRRRLLFFYDRILASLCRICSEEKLISPSRPLYCQQVIFLSPNPSNLPNLQVSSSNHYCQHNQLSHWLAILLCWKQTHYKLRQKKQNSFDSRFNTNSGQNHQRNQRQMWRKVGTVWPTWLWRAILHILKEWSCVHLHRDTNKLMCLTKPSTFHFLLCVPLCFTHCW